MLCYVKLQTIPRLIPCLLSKYVPSFQWIRALRMHNLFEFVSNLRFWCKHVLHIRGHESYDISHFAHIRGFVTARQTIFMVLKLICLVYQPKINVYVYIWMIITTKWKYRCFVLRCAIWLQNIYKWIMETVFFVFLKTLNLHIRGFVIKATICK